MSESTLVQIVGFFFQYVLSPVALLVIGAVLNRKIKETKEKITETKQEITNSHSVHLRDDLDGKFQLVFARQDTMTDMLTSIDGKVDDQATSVEQLFRTVADHERRLTGQAAKVRKISTGK